MAAVEERLWEDVLPAAVLPQWQRLTALAGAFVALIVLAASEFAALEQLDLEFYRPFLAPAAFLLALWLPLRQAFDWVRTRRVQGGAVCLFLALGAAVIGQWSDAALILCIGTMATVLRAKFWEDAYLPVRLWQQLLARASAPDYTVDAVEDENHERLLTIPTEAVVPCDGLVVDHSGLVSSLWHDTPTTILEPHDTVYAGDINLGEPLTVLPLRYGSHTALASAITRAHEIFVECEYNLGPLRVVLNRWSLYCSLVAVGMAITMPIIFGAAATVTLARSLSFLALAIPGACLVALELPPVAATGALLRRGMIPRHLAVFGRLSRLRMLAIINGVALTSRRSLLLDVLPLKPQACSPKELLAMAAAVETTAASEHPFGQAIRRAARDEGLTVPAARRVGEQPGEGISAIVDGYLCLVGSESFLLQHGVNSAEASQLVTKVIEADCVPVFCSAGDYLLGVLGLTDTGCQEWPRSAARLEKMKVKWLLLSGGDEERQQRTAWLPGGQWEVTLLSGQEIPTLRAWAGANTVIGVAGEADSDSQILSEADVGMALGPSSVLHDVGDLAFFARHVNELPWLVTHAQRLRRREIGSVVAAILSRLGLAALVWRGQLGALQVVAVDAALSGMLTLVAWRILGSKYPRLPLPKSI